MASPFLDEHRREEFLETTVDFMAFFVIREKKRNHLQASGEKQHQVLLLRFLFHVAYLLSKTGSSPLCF